MQFHFTTVPFAAGSGASATPTWVNATMGGAGNQNRDHPAHLETEQDEPNTTASHSCGLFTYERDGKEKDPNRKKPRNQKRPGRGREVIQNAHGDLLGLDGARARRDG